ncbi:MAG TPA: hypothetical protein VHC48_22145, partial [Puia sp.]|nr:hypothetical protein [Puia sp.]
LQLSAAELPANWAQWWWWRFNGPARVAASFGGAGIFCVVVLGPQLLAFLGVTWADGLILPWYWSTLLVMALTTVLWVTMALLTKPDPDKMLGDFYERVRPLGWWGRYGREKGKTGNVKPIFKGLGIALVGFAATSLLIQALTEMWFGRYGRGGIEIVVCLMLFIVFRKTSRSFLNFLEQRTN